MSRPLVTPREASGPRSHAQPPASQPITKASATQPPRGPRQGTRPHPEGRGGEAALAPGGRAWAVILLQVSGTGRGGGTDNRVLCIAGAGDISRGQRGAINPD